jgi:hypothetical protein
MAKQTTFKINDRFKNLRKELEQHKEESITNVVLNIAETLVKLSPVDTGAYVTSHSVKSNTSSRGRSKTSHGKPRGQNTLNKQQEGLDNLVQDINALDFDNLNTITIVTIVPMLRLLKKVAQTGKNRVIRSTHR